MISSYIFNILSVRLFYISYYFVFPSLSSFLICVNGYTYYYLYYQLNSNIIGFVPLSYKQIPSLGRTEIAHGGRGGLGEYLKRHL